MTKALNDSSKSDASLPRRPMQNLLAITTVLEFGTGLVLLTFPSLLTTILFDAQLDSLVGLTVARVGGIALLALGTACWFARLDRDSRAAQGVACAMVLYNAGVVVILVYSGLMLQLAGIGLWPAVAVHAVMAGWCSVKLLRRRS